eukprot:3318806-Prymnesium_polylepis.1
MRVWRLLRNHTAGAHQWWTLPAARNRVHVRGDASPSEPHAPREEVGCQDGSRQDVGSMAGSCLESAAGGHELTIGSLEEGPERLLWLWTWANHSDQCGMGGTTNEGRGMGHGYMAHIVYERVKYTRRGTAVTQEHYLSAHSHRHSEFGSQLSCES